MAMEAKEKGKEIGLPLSIVSVFRLRNWETPNVVFDFLTFSDYLGYSNLLHYTDSFLFLPSKNIFLGTNSIH